MSRVYDVVEDGWHCPICGNPVWETGMRWAASDLFNPMWIEAQMLNRERAEVRRAGLEERRRTEYAGFTCEQCKGTFVLILDRSAPLSRVVQYSDDE